MSLNERLQVNCTIKYYAVSRHLVDSTQTANVRLVGATIVANTLIEVVLSDVAIILTNSFTTDFENLSLLFANWSDIENQWEEPEFDFGNILAHYAYYESYDFASNGQPLPFIALQMTKNQENGDQRVVTSDYAVVVGVPAKVIRYKTFAQDIIWNK